MHTIYLHILYQITTAAAAGVSACILRRQRRFRSISLSLCITQSVHQTAAGYMKECHRSPSAPWSSTSPRLTLNQIHDAPSSSSSCRFRSSGRVAANFLFVLFFLLFLSLLCIQCFTLIDPIGVHINRRTQICIFKHVYRSRPCLRKTKRRDACMHRRTMDRGLKRFRAHATGEMADIVVTVPTPP